MAIETLPGLMVGLLPLVGISIAVKESIRKQHPKYGEERIEVCHDVPVFRGGTGKRENLFPATLPEHALQHLRDAEASEDWDTAKANYCATHLIVGRMTEHEYQDFCKMMETRKKR